MQGQHIQSIGDLHAPSVYDYRSLTMVHDEHGEFAVKILQGMM